MLCGIAGNLVRRCVSIPCAFNMRYAFLRSNAPLRFGFQELRREMEEYLRRLAEEKEQAKR